MALKVFPRILGWAQGSPVEKPKQGLYHYTYAKDIEKSRIHLRIEQDGSGVVMINADRILHVNPTAMWITKLHLEQHSAQEICVMLSAAFGIKKREVQQDVQDVIHKIDEMIRPDGACPIHELLLDTNAPFTAKLSAPYRMDLAITYRCNNDCHHCYNARARSYPELDTPQWKIILDTIWDLGIPHVVFTGGEPTLRNDLPELVAYAEQKGLVTGLNTNGRRLADRKFVSSLVDAGLDHVQVTLESHIPEIHDQMVNSRGAWQQTVNGIREVLKQRVYLMTNTTMLKTNYRSMAETLDFLAELGVPTIGLNSLIYSGKGKDSQAGLRESQLPAILNMAKEKTAVNGQRLIWYTPTEYCHFDPVNENLGVKGCTAAYYNMCIEPDGSVIPCQSYYSSLGNILSNSWSEIWDHPLAIDLRERRNVPQRCQGCSLLVECGGGCPLHQSDNQEIHWQDTFSIPAAS